MVVLGATGRNFAAGMSGGIAYVLDERGCFEKYCNMAQVELEAVESEDNALETDGRVDVSHDMTRFDEIRLKQLIENQQRYTGSEQAGKILDNWNEYLPKFVKVMPVEYRRALAEAQAQALKNHDSAVRESA